MTTLYKPVKIESAKQAETLPDGTIAFAPVSTDPHWAEVRERQGGEHDAEWWGRETTHAEMVGWTALVPIEAEEVEVVGFATGRTRNMLAIPWESA